MSELTLRRAASEDLDALVAHVAAGFESYRAFMPAGWSPPDMGLERSRMGETLADPGTWALLAEHDRTPVGHIAFMPGRERATDGSPAGARPVIPGLAHLWQLFVLPDWWGRGAASLLHERALVTMCGAGYARARLYAFARQTRARAFYERRGWTAAAELWSPELDADLVEYQLRLG